MTRLFLIALASFVVAGGCTKNERKNQDPAKAAGPPKTAAPSKTVTPTNPSPPGKTSNTGIKPMKALQLTWTLNKKANALHVNYTLQNNGAKAIYVLDQLLVLDAKGTSLAPDAVIVEQPTADGTVALVRGYVAPQADVRVRIIPGARKVGPSQSVTGRASLNLPLTAWHPRDGSAALGGKPAKAILKLGVVSGDTPLHAHALSDGTTVQAPAAAHMQHQQFVESAAQPLP